MPKPVRLPCGSENLNREEIFYENFLKPNSIDLAAFLGHFQQKNYVVKNYYWRDSEKRITGPFETYFRLRREDNHLKMIMAFIKKRQDK